MKAAEIKRGIVVEYQGANYSVNAVERSAPTARGGNTTFRFALYNVTTGSKLDVSLRADDELVEVELTRRPATFSYMEDDAFVLMDSEDYTQYRVGPEVAGELPLFFSEGLQGIQVKLIDDQVVGIALPQTVELTIVDTQPYLRGASATGRGKPAKLETGLEITVPEYVENGTRVKINTDTHEFSGRA
jgi:elongation factor P